MNVCQVVPWNSWPSGDERPIAIIPFEIGALQSRFGLVFQTGVDDFGPYHMAAVQLRRGEQAWLTKYDHDAHPGVTVRVDSRSEVEPALTSILKVFGLNPGLLLWAAESTQPEYASA